jgi:hypothetical protein
MAHTRFTCTLTTADEPACTSYARVTIIDAEGDTARGCPRHAVAALDGITGARVDWADSRGPQRARAPGPGAVRGAQPARGRSLIALRWGATLGATRTNDMPILRPRLYNRERRGPGHELIRTNSDGGTGICGSEAQRP